VKKGGKDLIEGKLLVDEINVLEREESAVPNCFNPSRRRLSPLNDMKRKRSDWKERSIMGHQGSMRATMEAENPASKSK